jgi:hypothetical protein
MVPQASFANGDADDFTFDIQSIAGLLQLHQPGITPGQSNGLSKSHIIPPTVPKSGSEVTITAQGLLESIVLKGIDISLTTFTPVAPIVTETGNFVSPDSHVQILPASPVQITSEPLTEANFGQWQITTPLLRAASPHEVNHGATSYGVYAAGVPTKRVPSSHAATYNISTFGWATRIVVPCCPETLGFSPQTEGVEGDLFQGKVNVDLTGKVTANIGVFSPFTDVEVGLTGSGVLKGSQYTLTLTGDGGLVGTATGNLYGTDARETAGTFSVDGSSGLFHIQGAFGGPLQ